VRKSLIPALATALVIGLVIAGTWAFFSDTETSSGNTFTAGTLELKLSDDGVNYFDGVSATWTMEDMIPGESTVGPNFLYLRNSGSIAAHHVEISFSHEVSSSLNPGLAPGEMARWLEITSMIYNGINLATVLNDANGNLFLDLEDVTLPPNTNVGGPLDNRVAPLPNGADIVPFTMALRFHEGATNDVQGATLTSTVTFTLNQDASQ